MNNPTYIINLTTLDTNSIRKCRNNTRRNYLSLLLKNMEEIHKVLLSILIQTNHQENFLLVNDNLVKKLLIFLTICNLTAPCKRWYIYILPKALPTSIYHSRNHKRLLQLLYLFRSCSCKCTKLGLLFKPEIFRKQFKNQFWQCGRM